MIEKFEISLKIQDKNGKSVIKTFENLENAADFFRNEYLRYAIGCIIFAEDMSEFENLDLNAYFEDRIKENDTETLEKLMEYITIWQKTFTDSLIDFKKCLILFNEQYSKELNPKPHIEIKSLSNNNDQ